MGERCWRKGNTWVDEVMAGETRVTPCSSPGSRLTLLTALTNIRSCRMFVLWSNIAAIFTCFGIAA